MVDRYDERLSVSFLLPNTSDDEYVLRSGVLHRAGTWCWQDLGIEGGGVQSRRQASKPAAAETTGQEGQAVDDQSWRASGMRA